MDKINNFIGNNNSVNFLERKENGKVQRKENGKAANREKFHG